MKLKYFYILSIMLLSGCATYGGYTPTVDVYEDKKLDFLSRDMAECKKLAENAGATVENTLKGATAGAFIGGSAGAAIAAIFGNPAIGAAAGGAAGGIGGALYNGLDADYAYKRAYGNCLRHRGHYVVD